MVELTLIRGLPGSGKSTIASKYQCVHFENDMYHIRDGFYDWKGSRQDEAMKWCLTSTRDCLKKGMDVVVSNTFTSLKYLKPYFDLANEIDDLIITVIECNNHYGTIHNVPDFVIEGMRSKWYTLTPEDIEQYNLSVIYDEYQATAEVR